MSATTPRSPRLDARVARILVHVGALMVASVVAAAVLAPWIAPHDSVKAVADSLGEPFAPQAAYPLGTDELGRDELSRLLYGARVSLSVATVATALTLVFGLAVGLTAGYAGGLTDALLMRATDVVLAFPVLLLALALSALLQPGLIAIFLVIGLVSWTGLARAVRGEVLSLRSRDFVTAARALGATGWRVLWRHILPNAWPTILVMTVLNTSNAVLLDAGLSYLGLGVPAPTPSWGRMLSDSQTYYRSAPWLMLFPGVAIVYTVLGFNLLAYGVLGLAGARTRSGA
jgi:peptide/nickel transport system permease protein